MAVLFTNNAATTLASGITSSATSISLAAASGALFPSPSGADYFYATLVDASNNIEIVKCTARSVDTLTVVRAQEGTTARAYSTGDKLELRPTAAGLNSKYDKAGGDITGSFGIPNAQSIGLLDANGGRPHFICQSNNDLVLYGTTTTGAFRPIWGVPMHSDTGGVLFYVTAAGPTPGVGDNSTTFATTAFVVTSFAPLASPPLTGVPTAPTAAQDTATTQIATTAFVDRFRDIPRSTSGFERGKITAWSSTAAIGPGSLAGTTYSIYNDSASAITITQSSGLTLRLAGTTSTGDRTLAARGLATIWFNSTTEAIISGAGLS